MERCSPQQRFVVIRSFAAGDEIECKKIADQSIMSTVHRTFFSALLRETTFQLMIFCSAILFIIVGVPFHYCVMSVPLTVSIVYASVWSVAMLRSLEAQHEMSLVKRLYQQSDKTNLLVAVYYGPLIDFDFQNSTISFVEPSDISENQLSSMNMKIVGYIGLMRSRDKTCCSWLKRLAVNKEFHRKGVATHLLRKASQFCYERGYSAIESSVTECQPEGREFFLNRGFELEQLYHKTILGSTAIYKKYLFRKDLLHSKSALNA